MAGTILLAQIGFRLHDAADSRFCSGAQHQVASKKLTSDRFGRALVESTRQWEEGGGVGYLKPRAGIWCDQRLLNSTGEESNM